MDATLICLSLGCLSLVSAGFGYAVVVAYRLRCANAGLEAKRLADAAVYADDNTKLAQQSIRIVALVKENTRLKDELRAIGEHVQARLDYFGVNNGQVKPVDSPRATTCATSAYEPTFNRWNDDLPRTCQEHP